MKLNKIVMTCIMFVAILLAIPMMSKASDDEMLEVHMTAMDDYKSAYEVLDLVNAERKKNGQTELVMDMDLMNAAMTRAREVIFQAEHTRPNGESFSTILPEKVINENLARRI